MNKKNEKFEYQGKTKEQVQFSEMMTGLSMLFMIIFIIFGVIISLISNPELR